MSKSCCFAVVLAVICLSVILLSLETDAQPTIDETMTCGASTLEEVVSVVKTIESNQHETAKDVKTLLGSGSVDKNETCRLEDVVKEIKDVKTLLGPGSVEKNETCMLEDVVKEIRDVKRLLVPAGIDETNETTLEEVVNMVKIVAANQQETAQEIKEIKTQINGVKTLVVSESADSNETTLYEVLNMVKVIALNQQENAKEIRDLKRLLVSGSDKTNDTSLETVVKEIKDEVKTLLASGCDETNDTRLDAVVKEVKEVKRLLTSHDKDCETVTAQPNNPLDYVTVDPSKQALVSALVCEYLVCLYSFTILTQH